MTTETLVGPRKVAEFRTQARGTDAVKLSAKLVTALAAIALLVVAVAGVMSNSTSALAETSSATIALDKAWYTAPDTITITVTDADSDTTSAATTTVVYDANTSGAAQFQNFTLLANLGDTNDDGTIDADDFDVEHEVVDGVDLNLTLFVSVQDAGAGFVTIGPRPGADLSAAPLSSGPSETLFISFATDTIETLTDAVTITSTQDSTGLLVSPVEGSASSGGEFEITVTIESGATTSDSNLLVANGDTITVDFTGGTSTDKDQAKVETTGPTIDVISPLDAFTTQDQTPTFTVQISDNESGVDDETIEFEITGVANSFANQEPADTTTAGGVITAEYTATLELVVDNSSGNVTWFVEVKDIAGNSSRTDSDEDTVGDQSHSVKVDQVAPELDTAETGTFWDTSIEEDDKTSAAADDDLNSLVAVFDEAIDGNTVDEADFTVGGITPIAAEVFSGAPEKVFITMAGAFDPDDIPDVEVVGNISDTAGNNTAVGEAVATDGIAPTFTASLSGDLTLDELDLTITANEPISGNVPTIRVSTPDGSDAGLVKNITGIKVTGTEAWEVTIEVAGDNLADGLNAVVITGSDSKGNPASLGSFTADGGKLVDADDVSDLTFTVDTDLASPTFTPADSGTTADSSPFVQVEYTEAVTLTAATFATGDGDAVDILAALNASTADNKLFVLAPGSYPGGASTLDLDSHTVTVSAVDAAGNESEDDDATFDIEERDDFELPLIAGWNLVSLPGAPSDPSINAVITVDEVGTVITFDPTVAGNFLTAVRDSVTGRLSGTLSTIDAQHGYWVNTTSFDPIEVFIPPIPAATLPPTVPVFEGWNLISVVDISGTASAGDGLTAVSTYLGGIDFSKVYRYAALTGTFASISGATTVEVGEGLWVFVNENGTITP